MSRVLVVDDDTSLLQSLDRLLRAEGLIPTTVSHGHGALNHLERGEEFDCVLLDVSMPEMDGFSCCRRIRQFSHVPIILLTARGDSLDRVLGLELGADDYVTKPFNPRELVARIRAVLRGRREYSQAAAERPEIIAGGLRLHRENREVSINGQAVHFTHREFCILLYLAERVGQAVSRDRLFEEVWGYESDLSGKSLDVYIRRIRQKIEMNAGSPTYIQTVRGFGYRFTAGDGVLPSK